MSNFVPIEQVMADFTTHFEDDAWISLIRGILPVAEEQAMLVHLADGCPECRQTHETWKRFVEIASNSGCDVATDSAARLVKAAFALRRRIPFRAGLAHRAETLFDSFLDPVPAGLRGHAASARQLLYEAGDYLVDFLLEQRTAGPGALTGQVVHAHADGATAGAGIVLVREPDTVLGQTIANSLGEFQMNFERSGNLRVCLGIPDGTFIEVPLPEAARTPTPVGSLGEAGEHNPQHWRQHNEK